MNIYSVAYFVRLYQIVYLCYNSIKKYLKYINIQPFQILLQCYYTLGIQLLFFKWQYPTQSLK